MDLYRAAAVVTLFSAAEHCLGFLYRIVLSRTIGSEGLGVYQAAYTVFAVFLTLSASGLPAALSRIISRHRAHGMRHREQSAVAGAALISLAVSVPVTLLLFVLRKPFSAVFADPRCADVFYLLLPGLACTSVYSVIRGSFWGNKQFFAYSFVELAEEMIRIGIGIALLLFASAAVYGANLAAAAVLLSYLCSFAIAAVWFFCKGGKLRAPRGELRPLLRASLPVTAMRASSSLFSSLISVLFPLQLQKAGVSPARAMSMYGVVYGMVMPVMAIPCAFIGSIALVLVPELSECYCRGKSAQAGELTERALRASLLISCALLPFYLVCGGDVGILLYSNAESGQLLSGCALLLLPMSLTMLSSSMLNSLGCERHTLAIFLAGSAAMLACTCLLPRYLGGGALLAGMACDQCLTSVLSLLLLKKKTGRLCSGKFLLRLACATAPAALLGALAHLLSTRFLSMLPALAVTMLVILAAEALFFSLLRLVSLRALFLRFFAKKRKNFGACS